MDNLKDLLTSRTIFFNYMKERYEVHYKSNIFLRDLLYAVKSYYEKKGLKLNYQQSEKLAKEFAESLVKTDELKVTGKNTWKVNFSFETSVKQNIT